MKKRKPPPEPRVLPVGTLVRVMKPTYVQPAAEVGDLGLVEGHLFLSDPGLTGGGLRLSQPSLIVHYVRMMRTNHLVSFHESTLEEVKDV